MATFDRSSPSFHVHGQPSAVFASVVEVTLKFRSFTVSAVGANSPLLGWIHLFADLNKDFSYISGKGFLTTRPQTETLKSVVGTLVMELCRGETKRSKTSCVDVLGFELRINTVRQFSMDCGVTVSFIYGIAYRTGTVFFEIPRLICVSFGITRLICASFWITRLICASDGIIRLIDVCVLRNH
ncbi:hypothetical protein E5676_scaffold2434G00010 [Cucumis melo var. makuwa]|uniref:Ty3-gypsy retrotransposon protein n=1 Tax=Cucumis melo var. makuwa TaxID=1194695 RepID=A0A5D3D1F6_CUCMM|nr:hypothetical protein E5676_scaffold2434G00010 [Cucumis melo var. makuwa]